jgi:hypothetical protein
MYAKFYMQVLRLPSNNKNNNKNNLKQYMLKLDYQAILWSSVYECSTLGRELAIGRCWILKTSKAITRHKVLS